MRLHVTGVGTAVLAAAAIGCSDRSQPLPAAPRMQAAAPTGSALTCDFKSLGNLATHYFGSTEAKIVRGLISQMQADTAFTPKAQGHGFDVMTHIASNIRAGNSDVADASNLTNGLLVCMYDPTTATGKAALPASFSLGSPEDFTVATDPSLDGGYDVRGPNDPVGAVLSRPIGSSFSGVAPCPGPDSTCTTAPNTWEGILTGNPDPKRVLIYGEPALLTTYEWRVVPRTIVFSPVAIVGFCIPASSATTSLIHENADLLPFVEQDFVPPCPPGLAAQSWSSQFASRLARWGIDLFGPKPLSATTYLNPGGLAGSTGSIHSLFGPQVVQSVTLSFTLQPHDASVNADIGPVTVKAVAVGTSTPVPNVFIQLSTVNNNGTPASLSGTTSGTTDATGSVTIDQFFQSKTGAYLLVASGSVNGRDQISVPAVTSDRFNIRP